MKADDLGTRIKENYENRTRFSLPRRTYTILRIDGKAFHTYARNCERPFDDGLISDMQQTALALCEQVQGCKFAYLQSDEISLVLTDFDELQTQAWFDLNLQKMVSISASIATAEFNKLRMIRSAKSTKVPKDNVGLYWKDALTPADINDFVLANFDSRAFSIASRSEVLNYLLWRQQDASKNSVSMVARSLYSHNELENKTTAQMQEMIFAKSRQNWNDVETHKKRGTCIYKVSQKITRTDANITGPLERIDSIFRKEWFTDKEAPIFSQDWPWFADKIPQLT